MNPRNSIVLTGFFPDQEKMGKGVMYVKGEGGKKSFYRGKISVRRSFKKPGEDKYPYDFIPFKAFGPSADYIHNYVNQNGGAVIQIMGELHVGENYEDKEGNTVYGTPEVIVDSVTILDNGDASGERYSAGDVKEPPKANAGAASKSPLARLRKNSRNVVA